MNRYITNLVRGWWILAGFWSSCWKSVFLPLDLGFGSKNYYQSLLRYPGSRCFDENLFMASWGHASLSTWVAYPEVLRSCPFLSPCPKPCQSFWSRAQLAEFSPRNMEGEMWWALRAIGKSQEESSLKNPIISSGFPGGSDGEESTCSVRDLGAIPGLGRSVGGGHGNPLQFSCLENPHRQRSPAGYSPLGGKESAMTERLSTARTKFTLRIIPISFPLLSHLLLISFSLSLFFCVSSPFSPTQVGLALFLISLE